MNNRCSRKDDTQDHGKPRGCVKPDGHVGACKIRLYPDVEFARSELAPELEQMEKAVLNEIGNKCTTRHPDYVALAASHAELLKQAQRALAWRALDGDGIDDPDSLRSAIAQGEKLEARP